LLLNDDVTLANNSIIKLIDAYNRSEAAENVILGAVMDMGKTKMTYGGYKLINKMNGDVEPVVPDEKELKECEVGNANIMLVDKNTFSKIGGLSEAYTHGLADFDY